MTAMSKSAARAILERASERERESPMQKLDQPSAMRRTPHPSECPHCEYDRRFPGFESGGWMQQDNNGPIVSCPLCNDDGAHPRQ